MDKEFYFRMVSFYNRTFFSIISPHFNDLPDDARNYLNLSRAFTYESFNPRNGIWETPWKQHIPNDHKMPDYDPNFNLSFDEVTDLRAHDVKKILEDDKKIAIFYSGGIDSTTCLTSLIKNLSKDELEKISVALSPDSIIENPSFYEKFIKDKLRIIDSTENTYSDLFEKGYICISSDLGDAIFGTELGTKMYAQLDYLAQSLSTNDKNLTISLMNSISDPDIHYSNFKFIISLYLNNILKTKVPSNYDQRDFNFGEYFYNKFDKNIKTSNIPVYSLHDFFWWIIFNIKYLHCAFRPGVLYGLGSEKRDIFKKGIIHWFGSDEYQLWSMRNNNNGEKIKGRTQSSYKWAARKYIYELDHNDWYFYHKIKIGSLPFVMRQNYKKYFKEFDPIFGMDTDYKMIYMGDSEFDDSVIESLYKFKDTL